MPDPDGTIIRNSMREPQYVSDKELIELLSQMESLPPELQKRICSVMGQPARRNLMDFVKRLQAEHDDHRI